MGAGHAILSPSGSDGWLECLGKPAMEHGFPDDSSVYADEGTAAHEIASMCLTNKHQAIQYIGETVHVKNGRVCSKTEANRANKKDVVNSFEVDDDMVANIQIYLDLVRDHALNDAQLLVEQRLPLSKITGEAGAKGTADAVVIRDDELTVIDLKFGRGVEVRAENNSQLLMYMLAAYDEYNGLLGEFTKFRVVISQPRKCEAPSEWDFGLDVLEKFRSKVKATAPKVIKLYEERDAWVKFDSQGGWIGEASELKATGKGCMFCKAKAVCPELARVVKEELVADFELIATAAQNDMALDSAVDSGALVSPHSLTSDQLGTKLQAVDLIEDFCRAVRAEVERRLLSEINVDGWKLVQGKRGNRAWRDADEAEETFKSMRLRVDEMYNLKLISPTQAEKKLKDTPKRWKRLAPLVTQSNGKPSVAPAYDKRPALSVAPDKEDFADETGGDLAA